MREIEKHHYKLFFSFFFNRTLYTIQVFWLWFTLLSVCYTETDIQLESFNISISSAMLLTSRGRRYLNRLDLLTVNKICYLLILFNWCLLLVQHVIKFTVIIQKIMGLVLEQFKAATPTITTRWQCHPVTYSSLLRKALRSMLLSITVRVWVSVQSFINPVSHITDHIASVGFTICTVNNIL